VNQTRKHHRNASNEGEEIFHDFNESSKFLDRCQES
jgi:hypothetical protein